MMHRRLSPVDRLPRAAPGPFRRQWLALLAVTIGYPALASATTENDLCMPTDNPCRVTRAVTVTFPFLIDVGNRQLLIQSGGSLNVGTETMTIFAGDVTVQAGGALSALGGVSSEGGTINVTTDTATIGGDVDVSGAPGGGFSLGADGDITIAGRVNANSRRVEEDGGIIGLRGARVVLSGSVTARGSRDAIAGEIEIIASRDLFISGSVNASGDDGGTVSLEAGSGGAGNLTVTSTGEVVAEATGADGAGDFLDVAVSGDGGNTGNLRVDGRVSLAATIGGDGGSLDASVSGSFTAGTTARILTSARFGGDGGDIDLTADAGGLDIAGTIDTSGAGSGGRAGDVALDIAAAAILRGVIDARGGRDGGDVEVGSGADVSLVGTIRSEGSAPGLGGTVSLAGCIVDVADTGTLSSLGPNGVNRMTGATLTVLRGTMRANVASGRNEIIYGDEPPMISASASVTPPVTLKHDPNLVPCGVTRTPTPTITQTPTPSPTRTPRSGPCVGDCNGDGRVSVDELVIGVSIALAQMPLDHCPIFADGGTIVDVQDLVLAVSNSLDGCE